MRGGGEEGVREKFKALAKIPTAVKNRALACTVPSKPEEGALRFSDGTDIKFVSKVRGQWCDSCK